MKGNLSKILSQSSPSLGQLIQKNNMLVTSQGEAMIFRQKSNGKINVSWSLTTEHQESEIGTDFTENAILGSSTSGSFGFKDVNGEHSEVRSHGQANLRTVAREDLVAALEFAKGLPSVP